MSPDMCFWAKNTERCILLGYIHVNSTRKCHLCLKLTSSWRCKSWIQKSWRKVLICVVVSGSENQRASLVATDDPGYCNFWGGFNPDMSWPNLQVSGFVRFIVSSQIFSFRGTISRTINTTKIRNHPLITTYVYVYIYIYNNGPHGGCAHGGVFSARLNHASFAGASWRRSPRRMASRIEAAKPWSISNKLVMCCVSWWPNGISWDLMVI